MKISKKSWHYRMLKAWQVDKNLDKNGDLKHKNLCSYFGELVFLLFFLITFVIPGCILLSPFILLFYLFNKAEEYGWISTAPPIEKEPKTLLGQWIKAKKQKVCPIVEWTE